ncbi:ATP-binding protein [Defluviitalea raffinosedens]|uniref:ATP-binding protein n=1 Tax=Defluviitalea raffinosedens TaxID=1450156 RepID=UPI001752FD44|nr:4Fe-4S binding protein [Defluviitalea raffinosedens]MBM7685658.1 MinD superfamily P-loop ATPase [Defluviitalea raffinosedens]HHW66504.1 4Fe-4S binding protein [Candidatus Epulonipiscium sp.]
MNKAIVSQSECVACGVCKKVCSRQAITIFHGIYADVNEDLCIGCKKCEKACPASVIQVTEREVKA